MACTLNDRQVLDDPLQKEALCLEELYAIVFSWYEGYSSNIYMDIKAIYDS